MPQSPRPRNKRVFELKSKIMRPATTSNYEVAMSLNGPVSEFLSRYNATLDSDKQQYLTLACSEASLPGSTFATHDVNDDFTGVSEKMAYRKQYDGTIDLTFYVDHGHYMIELFDRWMNYIAGEGERGRGGASASLGDGYFTQDKNYNYRVNFPDDYKIDSLFISKFEKDLRDDEPQRTVYRFVRAFPIALNSMPVSYDASQLLKLTVSFSYTRYLRARIGGKSQFDYSVLGNNSAGEIDESPNPFNSPITLENLF